MIEIIHYLANILSTEIKISPPAARGLIKLSIKDELGPFKPIFRINYTDLKNTLENSLKKRLNNLNVNDSDQIIKNLVFELTNNQSIIKIGNV